MTLKLTISGPHVDEKVGGHYWTADAFDDNGNMKNFRTIAQSGDPNTGLKILMHQLPCLCGALCRELLPDDKREIVSCQ